MLSASMLPAAAAAAAAVLAAGCTATLAGDPGDPPDPADPADPGDPSDPGDPEDPGGGGPPGAIPFGCPAAAGGPIAPGVNTLSVGGAARRFFADFPPDTSRPLGVVFSWHGFMDSAEAFRGAAGLDPAANPDRPVVVITPDDTDLLPPAGLGWDIFDVDDNVDLALFEAVLGCLDEQYALDAGAIYSFGFSAGSVMTNLIHASYPDLVTTIVTESGAWFDDPAQIELVAGALPVPIAWNWPVLDPADGGTVLLTHGGPDDVTVANVMDLEAAAQAALPFLAAAARVVVDCAHDRGHVLDPNVTAPVIVRFLTGQGGAALPATCTPRLP